MAADLYFNESPLIFTPRLAVSLDGLDKRGKSHWAICTTPDPIKVIKIDTGTDSAITKARSLGKRVQVMPVEFDIPDMSVIKAQDIDATQAALWRKEWNRIVAACKLIQSEDPKNPTSTRTLVIDTGTALNKLLELAHFGKARGNARQDLRTEMNGAYHKLFWDLYNKRKDLNIILIHQDKKQYVQNSKGDSVWNGKYERDGNNKTGFYVDLSVHCDWEPGIGQVRGDFYTEIMKDQPFRYLDLFREGGDSPVIGKKWYASNPGDPSAFWNLGMTIFPETEETPEIWGV